MQHPTVILAEWLLIEFEKLTIHKLSSSADFIEKISNTSLKEGETFAVSSSYYRNEARDYYLKQLLECNNFSKKNVICRLSLLNTPI